MNVAHMNRRRFAMTLAATTVGARPAWAQALRASEPMRLVAPFAAGGAADTVGRILSAKLADVLERPVIVENRAGASGAIGSAYVASRPPDGHTLLINLGPPHHTVHLFSKSVAYDPVNDFTGISLIATAPQALVVPASSPYKTAREFITAAQASQKSLSYGTSGIGTSQHLAGLMLASSQRANLTHVGYRGGSAALTDVLGGQTDAAIVVLSNVLPYLRTGRLRALAVLENHRALGAPGVPTLAEGGIQGVSIPDTWVGVLGPAKLPSAIVGRVNAAIGKVLRDAGVRAQLEKAGYEPKGAAPHEFARQMADSQELFQRIVKTAGITPE